MVFSTNRTVQCSYGNPNITVHWTDGIANCTVQCIMHIERDHELHSTVHNWKHENGTVLCYSAVLQCIHRADRNTTVQRTSGNTNNKVHWTDENTNFTVQCSHAWKYTNYTVQWSYIWKHELYSAVLIWKYKLHSALLIHMKTRIIYSALLIHMKARITKCSAHTYDNTNYIQCSAHMEIQIAQCSALILYLWKHVLYSAVLTNKH